MTQFIEYKPLVVPLLDGDDAVPRNVVDAIYDYVKEDHKDKDNITVGDLDGCFSLNKLAHFRDKFDGSLSTYFQELINYKKTKTSGFVEVNDLVLFNDQHIISEYKKAIINSERNTRETFTLPFDRLRDIINLNIRPDKSKVKCEESDSEYECEDSKCHERPPNLKESDINYYEDLLRSYAAFWYSEEDIDDYIKVCHDLTILKEVTLFSPDKALITHAYGNMIYTKDRKYKCDIFKDETYFEILLDAFKFLKDNYCDDEYYIANTLMIVISERYEYYLLNHDIQALQSTINKIKTNKDSIMLKRLVSLGEALIKTINDLTSLQK